MMPHSAVAEQTLLGMLMLDNNRLELLDGKITQADFYVPLYADIFTTLYGLVRDGVEAIPPTIIPRLIGKYTEIELAELCVKAFEYASTAVNIASIAHVISEMTLRRRILSIAKSLTEAAEAGKADDVTRLQKELSDLHKGFSDFVPETPRQQIISAIEAAHSTSKMMLTGFESWDREFGGIFREKIYTISGYGGAGKSAMGVTIGWNMAKAGHKVRWVSWEEDREAIWGRVLSRECRIDVRAIRDGSLTEGQSGMLSSKGSEMMAHDFLAYYKLKDKSQIIDACGQCDLIVIDGMSRYPCKGESLIDRVANTMQEVGEIALRTGASVLLLSHVNGDSVKNGATISSLYGGQAATFDPEGIVDIRAADDHVGEYGRRAITMTVLKNRYGKGGGKTPLWFEGAFMHFYEQGKNR